MAETATRAQVLVARAAVAIVLALIVAGVLMYGLSTEVRGRIWKDLADRPGGPMTFRFILQPMMAAIVALVDGIKDARLRRDPYLWTILTDANVRSDRLRDGLIATGRIILLGLGMDAIYQAIVLKTFYPGEMAIVAVLLAFIPYVLLRGPFERIARWWMTRNSAGQVR